YEGLWQNMLATAGGSGIGDFLANGTVPMTGAFLATVGTAATPSIAFNGDADTGMWSYGLNKIAFSTGGTGRMYIDNLGEVGIGTNNPTSNITIGTGGGSSAPRQAININNNGWDVPSNSNSTSLGDKFVLWNEAAQKSAVGIGANEFWFQMNGQVNSH